MASGTRLPPFDIDDETCTNLRVATNLLGSLPASTPGICVVPPCCHLIKHLSTPESLKSQQGSSSPPHSPPPFLFVDERPPCCCQKFLVSSSSRETVTGSTTTRTPSHMQPPTRRPLPSARLSPTTLDPFFVPRTWTAAHPLTSRVFAPTLSTTAKSRFA